MTPVDRIKDYLQRLCIEMGVEEKTLFNPKTASWYFVMGSSTIEVFLTTQKNLHNEPQTFIRGMAALCAIPGDRRKQFELYKTVLAINATYLGYKISAEEDRGLVCIISERNISGMDYYEMVTLIMDLGEWADKLDKFLKEQFGE
ncbi:MAG: YbjN domain-containing protein [Chitinophagaceae bacterium]|nr:YbjN domain-containing protein [Chitinophagaceae bacterium]